MHFPNTPNPQMQQNIARTPKYGTANNATHQKKDKKNDTNANARVKEQEKNTNMTAPQQQNRGR
jgi:hypothetical protein